jgi:hypothetical protein
METSGADCRLREMVCPPAESIKQKHGHRAYLFFGEGM